MSYMASKIYSNLPDSILPTPIGYHLETSHNMLACLMGLVNYNVFVFIGEQEHTYKASKYTTNAIQQEDQISRKPYGNDCVSCFSDITRLASTLVVCGLRREGEEVVVLVAINVPIVYYALDGMMRRRMHR